jgi:hypothetical protein
LTASTDGWGHINVIPYYNVQDGNETNISITNPDLHNGKAVKVRFRGAEWSDDVLDFTVFLSPGDQWTGVFADAGVGGTGVALISNDSTCTSPRIPTAIEGGAPFETGRLDIDKRTTGALEGYIEVIVLADIPPITATTGLGSQRDDNKDELTPPNWGSESSKQTLYNAIKHKNESGGKPACRTDTTAQKLIDSLVEDNWWVWHDGNNAGHFDIGGLASNVDIGSAAFNASFAQPNAPQFGSKRFVGSGDNSFSSDKTVTVDEAVYNTWGDSATAAATAAARDDWLQPSGWNKATYGHSGVGVGVYSLIVNPANSRAFTIPAEAYSESLPIKLFFKQDNKAVAYGDRPDLGTVAKRSRNYSSQTVVDRHTAYVTADRIFYPLGRDDATTVGGSEGVGLQLLEFDLPDLSTPTNVNNATRTAPDDSDWGSNAFSSAGNEGGPAFYQRAEFAKAIKDGHNTLYADFATDAASGASTDIVLSQPLRRYYYQYYNATNTPVTGKAYHRHFGYYTDDLSGTNAGITQTQYYANVRGDNGTAYEHLDGGSNQIPAACPGVLDSEERRVSTAQSGVSFSPKPPIYNAACGYQGEVAVLDLNGSDSAHSSAALGAILTRSTVDLVGITNGWATFSAVDSGTTTVTSNWHYVSAGIYEDKTTYPIIGFRATNYSGGLARSIVLPFKY